MSMTESTNGRPIPRDMFEIGAMDVAGARVVWCRGELDVSCEERVKREVAVALGRPVTTVVLDLRGLTFADCTVVRCIEYAAAACERCHVTLYVDSGEAVRRLTSTIEPELLGVAKHFI